MKKKMVLSILITSILCTLSSFPIYATDAQTTAVDILLDSRYFAVGDQLLRIPLFSYQGDIYVPLQSVEAKYQSFAWDEATQTATIKHNTMITAELERRAERWAYPNQGRGSYRADYVRIIAFDAETLELTCEGNESYIFTLTEQEAEQYQEMLLDGLVSNSEYRLTAYFPWPLMAGPYPQEVLDQMLAPRFVELTQTYSMMQQAIIRPITVHLENADGMANSHTLSIDALEYDGLLYLSIHLFDETIYWFTYGLIMTAYADEPMPTQFLPVIAPDVRVILDSEVLSFDVPIFSANQRLLVPLRSIFEAMGAEVVYDDREQTVTATKGETVVVLVIGDSSPTINGQIVTIDQPGLIVDGRTMAPLRFVAEAFGGIVVWDPIIEIAAIWTGEPKLDNIAGTWEYVRSTEGDGETALYLHELTIASPRMEIKEDDTISILFYESRSEGTLTRRSPYAYDLNYAFTLAEGERYYRDWSDLLAYDPISKALRYTFTNVDVHHYFKRK